MNLKLKSLLIPLLAGASLCACAPAPLQGFTPGQSAQSARVNLRLSPAEAYRLQQLQPQDVISDVDYTLLECPSEAICEGATPATGSTVIATRTLHCYPCDTPPYDFYSSPGGTFELSGLLASRFYSVQIVVRGHRTAGASPIVLASGFPNQINGQRGYLSTDASGRISSHNSQPANQLNVHLTAVP